MEHIRWGEDAPLLSFPRLYKKNECIKKKLVRGFPLLPSFLSLFPFSLSPLLASLPPYPLRAHLILPSSTTNNTSLPSFLWPCKWLPLEPPFSTPVQSLLIIPPDPGSSKSLVALASANSSAPSPQPSSRNDPLSLYVILSIESLLRSSLSLTNRKTTCLLFQEPPCDKQDSGSLLGSEQRNKVPWNNQQVCIHSLICRTVARPTSPYSLLSFIIDLLTLTDCAFTRPMSSSQ